MILLDTKPETQKKRRRFYFDKRWIGEEVIRAAWDTKCIGSPMFRVAYKIKKCEWNLLSGIGSKRAILLSKSKS